MRTATESDVLRLAGQLEAAALVLREKPNCACKTVRRNQAGELVEIPACKSKTDHALRVARQAAGFIGSSGPGSHGGDIADPTLAVILQWDKRGRRHMSPEWWHERISRDAALASAAIADLIVVISELGLVTSTDPKELTKNGQGTCPACDRFCSGAVNDRLISGLCDTDYRAWLRAGRPERFEFVQSRRLENGKCKHPSTIWHQGETVCRVCGQPVEAA